MSHQRKEETIQKNRKVQKERRYILIASLLLIPACIYVWTLQPQILQEYSLQAGSGRIITAFTYQLLHLNIFHLLANIWALASIVCYYRSCSTDLLLAYTISILYGLIVIQPPLAVLPCSQPFLAEPYQPPFPAVLQALLPHQHIVGFSAVLFAMFGLRTIQPNMRHTMTNLLVFLATITITAPLSNISIHAHASCYILAVLYTLIIKPHATH